MKLILLAMAVAAVVADVYMHGPRGSNNRLNEEGRERKNQNRLFDSQNNNRGGYNQGNLYYYAGSTVNLEWTNQHSCDNVNNHCELVVQMMCGEMVRDGTTTTTIPDHRYRCDRWNCNTDLEYGMHENYEYYRECDKRYRNKGLYTADRNMREHARSTRQNNNANRFGYECPEERDYYPYWHPTPWMDIAVFTNEPNKRCPMYKKESQNVKNKGYCKYPDNFLDYKEAQGVHVMIMNNKEDCEAHEVEHGGEIVKPKWVEIGAHNIPSPECKQSPWSRDNQLGNGKDGFPNTYNWTIPEHTIHKNCVLRLRYNITTAELNDGGFDSSIDASLNAEKEKYPTKIDIATQYGLDVNNDRGYQFKQNPTVSVFNTKESDGVTLDLALALNTHQYGRTFQDRSHVFEIRARPDNIPKNAKIHNLNVRGKRGNIVQTYPGVEYDFQPNRLEADQGDYIHIQWTGANSNPQNNDGQGRRGTDRSNMLVIRDVTWDKANKDKDLAKGCFACNYPDYITNSTDFLGFSKEELLQLAYHETTHFRGDIDELDDTSTYFDMGLKKLTKAGIWRYLCTRNNNFTNRSQKGMIHVDAKSTEKAVRQ